MSHRFQDSLPLVSSGRVARQQPPSTRKKPATVAAVIVSSSTAAPSTIATAGFTNVINVAALGTDFG